MTKTFRPGCGPRRTRLARSRTRRSSRLAEPGNDRGPSGAERVAAEDRDDAALGAALVSMGLIGRRERQDLYRAQAENDSLVAAQAR